MSMNCAACEAVKSNAPSVIANGMGDAECASLANDTGLTPSVGHNDCTDLNDLNDCLIGNMDEEIETQEICDWKPFTKRLIANLWTVEKAIICAVCGLWTNVHSLWAEIQRLWAEIQRLWAEIGRIWADITNIWDKINELLASVGSFSLVKSGRTVSLVNNSGTVASVSDDDTRYRFVTRTYEYPSTISLGPNSSDKYTIECLKPPNFLSTETARPFAMAGWMIEGDNTALVCTRYAQMINREDNRCEVRVAIVNNSSTNTASFTLQAEVFWVGVRLD